MNYKIIRQFKIFIIILIFSLAINFDFKYDTYARIFQVFDDYIL